MNRVNAPSVVKGLSILYFSAAAFVILFLLTDYTHVVPPWLKVMFVFVVLWQCTVGRGLWRLQNWARIAAVISSAFLGIPLAINVLIAFRSLSILNLLLNLSGLTVQGMIIWYLVHAQTRSAFDNRPTELHLE